MKYHLCSQSRLFLEVNVKEIIFSSMPAEVHYSASVGFFD
jgi:hypothetical protein